VAEVVGHKEKTADGNQVHHQAGKDSVEDPVEAAVVVVDGDHQVAEIAVQTVDGPQVDHRVAHQVDIQVAPVVGIHQVDHLEAVLDGQLVVPVVDLDIHQEVVEAVVDGPQVVVDHQVDPVNNNKILTVDGEL